MKKHRDESISPFIEYLQIEKNCSENTIVTYKRDLGATFPLFMSRTRVRIIYRYPVF